MSRWMLRHNNYGSDDKKNLTELLRDKTFWRKKTTKPIGTPTTSLELETLNMCLHRQLDYARICVRYVHLVRSWNRI